MNVKVGQRFRLKADFGNEPGSSNPAFHPEGIQNEDGTVTIHPFPDGWPLRAGADGDVVAVALAADEGAGNHDEDHAVLQFGTRLVSFTDTQIADLFEESA